MTVRKKGRLKDISFEEAITRLEALVRELEDSRLPLADALEMFKEGVELTHVCNGYLEDAEQRLMILTADEKDKVSLQTVEQVPFAAGDDKVEF